MIVHTSYREHGAGDLVRYIGRDANALRDRAGRELSDREIRAFVAQSEQHGFERDLILSPDRGDELSERELERATRETVAGWERESDRSRGSARWCYAVHQDTDHTHVHVAMTGTKHDLYMDRDDIEQVRERGREQFREQEREAEREQQREQAREQARDQSRGIDR